MEYKERYFKAKEELSKLEDKTSNLALLLTDTINELEEKYPELKETEDERIRKALIRGIESVCKEEEVFTDGFTRKQIISWLEKQGEQHSDDRFFEGFEKGKRSVLDHPEEYNLHHLTDDQMIEELCREYERGKRDALAKQKPAEWSVVDETILTNTIIMLKEGASLHFNKKDITKAVDWLKSLKPANN